MDINLKKVVEIFIVAKPTRLLDQNEFQKELWQPDVFQLSVLGQGIDY